MEEGVGGRRRAKGKGEGGGKRRRGKKEGEEGGGRRRGKEEGEGEGGGERRRGKEQNNQNNQKQGESWEEKEKPATVTRDLTDQHSFTNDIVHGIVHSID